jgi:hypothetical protein
MKRPLKSVALELLLWALVSIATAVILAIVVERYAPPNF